MRPVLVASALLALSGVVGGEPEDTTSLEDQLERARELNTTAPWNETRALLELIELRLPEATPEQQADFWLVWARNQSLAGNMQGAVEKLEWLFEQPLTPGQEAHAYSLAANIAVLLRRWEDTFGYLSHALELAGRLDAAEMTNQPFSLAAYIYAMIGQTGRAIDHGKRAVVIAREVNDLRGMCTGEGRLAFAYKTADEIDLAHRHYLEALSHCRETGDDLITGTIESGLADLLREAGKFERARELFRQALSRLERTNYHYGQAEARFYKARLHWETGEHAQARSLLGQALPSLKQDQAWDHVAEAHQMLAAIEIARGDHEPALEHMREQLDARERFLDLERARQLAHLQVAFDTRSREQEVALLREQRRVSELQSESRRHRDRLRWLVYAFTAFLFLVLVLLLLHVLRERRHFRRLAGLDSLTGLSNHTRFFDTARMSVDRVRNEGRPLVLAMGDIDYFKRVNDECGHIAGDRALGKVADVLREGFPESAHIGRIGGEEFAICLPGETVEHLRPRLDAVRAALAKVDYGGNGKPLSMSFGVAELEPDEPLERLRERADTALYRAKHGGRDTVVIADPSGRH